MDEGRGIDWLASYPKSGNTWLRVLLANYFSERDDPHDINAPGVTRGIAGSRWLFDTYLGLPSSEMLSDEIGQLRPRLYEAMAARAAGPLWLKVHDMQQRRDPSDWLIPPGVSRAVVYIIRNPLDVAVSNAFHDGDEDMERAVAKICRSGQAISDPSAMQLPQVVGDWSEHVLSWVEQELIRLLVVRYEDMLADAADVLARVIRFTRPGEMVDEHKVSRAVWHSRLAALQAAEAANGFREAPSRTKPFFRAGRAGDWRNHLSPTQAGRICTRHAGVMARFGYTEAAAGESGGC